MFESRGVVSHLDAARDQLRAERKAVAHKLIEAGTFALARMAGLGHGFEDRIVDDWELVAAELGVELGISRGRACTLITHGRDLITRLPAFAAVFATGAVDMRVLRVILYRTALILDPDIMAVIDAQLAERAPSWNPLSDERIADLVDAMIVDVDPEAVRRARQARQQRGITVEPVGDGMVEIHGRVDAVKGAVFDQGLDALARTVCPDDPRSFQERRADAVEPLALGAKSIPCLCGREDCPAAGNEVCKGHFVIHVLAEQATVTGASPKAALIPGYGVVHAEQIQQVVPHAEVRPVPEANDLGSEPGYQPSKKLTDFIGCRDLTCRWPGCNVPAGRCDIDHTTPWPYGPTHPSNTKLYCRIHHLIKTFHCGPGGWTDQHHPDGTVTITAPSGRVYTTTPDGALLFPQIAFRTAELGPITVPPPSPHRELAAPTRSRTRAQNRTYRIAHERALNRIDIEANPPPF